MAKKEKQNQHTDQSVAKKLAKMRTAIFRKTCSCCDVTLYFKSEENALAALKASENLDSGDHETIMVDDMGLEYFASELCYLESMSGYLRKPEPTLVKTISDRLKFQKKTQSDRL